MDCNPPPAGLLAARGLATLRAHLVFFSYYQSVMLFPNLVCLTVALACKHGDSGFGREQVGDDGGSDGGVRRLTHAHESAEGQENPVVVFGNKGACQRRGTAWGV
jgi:hypothetical protein